MQITSSCAIITGGASGMGAATARYLHQRGVKIALLDLNESLLKNIAAEINALAIPCDVTDNKSVENAIQQAQTHFGAIHICINCAGIVYSRRMVNKEGIIPLAEFQRVIQINLIGTFNVMSQVAAQMIKQEPLNADGERGVIINTASVAAFDGQIGQTAYSASKGGIVGLTLPAARELAQFGIRVMTIAPGLVDTPMFAQLSDVARASLASTIPFPKRLADPSEYAKLVAHIIENPMLNGEVIRLDGALRMQEK